MTTQENFTKEKTTDSTDKNIAPKEYPCPRCQKLTAWQDNRFKPFCAERCKMIDLGAWASGDYKIASADTNLFSSDLLSNNQDSDF